MVIRSGPALVTGASAGLGREYARALAARGHDLVVVARRADRLNALREELTGRFGVAVETLVCDLATDDGLADCRRALERFPLEIAVLNAGFGSLGPFVDADREREDRMVRVNCLAVVDLARSVLPGMVSRGSGQVIVISSAAAWHPVPYMATYAATKAFEMHFVRALSEEVRGSGVGVLAVCPGPTQTEFSEVLTAAGRVGSGWPSFMPIDRPRDVVERTLRAVDQGRSVVATGRVATLTRIAGRIVPSAWSLRVVGTVHRRRARTRATAGNLGEN
jgi:hypothetical protein